MRLAAGIGGFTGVFAAKQILRIISEGQKTF